MKVLGNGKEALSGITGIHVHSNCEADNFDTLIKTVLHLDKHLSGMLSTMKWINLGGGYLFEREEDLVGLAEAIDIIKRKYDIEVFFEPGKAIVGNAGYLVSTIVDIFENDGRKIAILDTTVNHFPEVFEYQYKPEIIQERKNGKFSYILAGATCLSGDIFGEYQFEDELAVGSRIVFKDVGAYSLVKAHMFNGINLPTIYAYTVDKQLEMKKQYTYGNL